MKRAPAGRPSQALAIDAIGFFSFFAFGSLTSLNDIIMPKLKELFQLTYGEMTMVQFCFFTSYAIISIPAAYLIGRIGYVRSLAAGFLIMAVGCTLFLPAAWTGLFPPFLAALFILAAGVTIVQVTANPLIISLGTPQTTPPRLTFAHACNSIGTVVAPFIGAILILGAAGSKSIATKVDRVAEAGTISRTYLVIAAALVVIASVVWLLRNGLGKHQPTSTRVTEVFGLLKRPRFAFGVFAMALYVGAEVAIGSLLVSYLTQSTTLALNAQTAGRYLAFYWGGLLVGRLIGVFVLRLVPAARLIMAYAAAAALLVCLSIFTTGSIAGWAMIAVGLCNSIMFPLIFALTSEGLDERAADGSGLICVAIVGGAIVPFVTGNLADVIGLTAAMVVPALCYVGIMAFGWFVRRSHLSNPHLA